jgi:aminoglycoside phosphotransferase (APT) family kinase protein
MTGARIRFDDLPEDVRQALAVRLGSPVTSATGAPGGYGAGLAARCSLADGRSVFIKAASPVLNPDTPDIMRAEAANDAMLPATVPAPRLLEVLDDGHWVVLVFTVAPGKLPVTDSWDPRRLVRFARAVAALGTIAAPAAAPALADVIALDGWARMAEQEVVDPTQWWSGRLAELAALEARWADASAGDRIVHADLRADNCLMGEDTIQFVDWTTLAAGAGWFDLVAGAPSIELQGGGAAAHVLEIAGITVSDEDLVPVVAALAGYFTHSARRPAPAGMPAVRSFQHAQAAAAGAWLRHLIDW